MKTIRAIATVVALICSVATGCASDDGGSATGAKKTNTGEVTFHKDVAPIVYAKCASCHLDGAIGPFDITKPDVARAMAPAIGAAIDSGRMPPWGALETAECKPPLKFKHDLRLTGPEKQTIAAWIAAGAPAGDAADSAKLAPPKPLGLDKVDRSIKPDKGFVAAGSKDQYICFPLDPKLDKDAWMTGVHFVAGNPVVAHHALLFADPTGEAFKKAGSKGYYSGFGGCGVSGGLIAAWAPGGAPVQMPDNAGVPLKKGTKLVMQMHYHPVGPAAAEDKTTVQLRLTFDQPKWNVTATLQGNARKESAGLQAGPDDNGKIEFKIPAGKTAHPEVMGWTLPKSVAKSGLDHVKIMGVATHMHILGKDMRIWVKRRANDDFDGAACSASDKVALEPCLLKNCDGKSGKSASDCAVKHCGVQLQAIDKGCLQCLSVANDGKAKDIWAQCEGGGKLPAGPAGSDKDICLLHTPEYDFDWQRFYTFDAPIEQLPVLRPGDTLMMRCVYDNSMGNKALAAELKAAGMSAPVDVGIGEETLDEMCLAALYVLYPMI